IQLGYTTYGTFDPSKNNVIWICHALTANSDPMEWWPGLVGEGLLYDPKYHFIVCANMLGSCYGSTCPETIDPRTGLRYGLDFPLITIRDMIRSMQLLRDHLGIEKISLATGGSMGGQQVLEWAIMEPQLIDQICVIGTNARHSPWGIAFNEAQRMAIEADQTLTHAHPEAGSKGLQAARATAMLSYRNYEAYHRTQMETEAKLDDYKASSYQRYQGLKLSRRFSPLAYLTLSKAMDNHDVGRNRGSIESALAEILAKTLIFGIETDFLFPIREQELLHQLIQGSELHVIDSPYGHDGFLIEFSQITDRVRSFMRGKI
ncbi:MAG: homoserine O-acetyltransferase, partial [Saprospiraceae bacterium]|nr:homoserine O-acetyltransferase [Saprospiraceae bacterium]